MATPGMSLDKPPAQPSDLAAVTSALGNKVQQQQPAQPASAPSGNLAVHGEAVRRVVEQMNGDPKFAPYGERILALLKAGLGEASGAPSSPQPAQGAAASPGAPAGSEGGFPG